MAKNENWGDICTQVNTCALTGAAAFFAGIPQAEILVNGSNWCYFYALRHIEKAIPSVGSRFRCTQVNNQDIVYGTEDRIIEALKEYEGKSISALLIENSCAVGLIGDDLEGITKGISLEAPKICLDSGGLIGGFYEGYQLASQKYFESLEFTPLDIKKKAVNLIGATESYFNGKNDIAELKRMLTKAGYEIIACPGAGSSAEEILRINEAEINIVVHSELGLKLAEFLERQFSTPFINMAPPYGLEGTRQWISTIAEKIPTDLTSIQEELDETEQNLFGQINEFRSIWGDLWFEKAVISAPSSVAFGLYKALRTEWADMGELTLILQDSPEKMDDSHEADQILFSEKDGPKVEEVIKNLRDGFLMGSSCEKTFLVRHKIREALFCNIHYPIYDELLLIQEPFMGIRGTSHMLQRIWNHKISYQQHIQEEKYKNLIEEVKVDLKMAR